MDIQHLKLAALFLLFSLSLAGCTSLTPAGLIAASKLDPLNSDASDIAVAVSVPTTMRLKDGDAQFHLSFVTENTTISETVPLQLEPGLPSDISQSDSDQALYVASFTPQDAAKISATQARIKALKAAGQDGDGTLSVAVTGGCLTKTPMDAIPVSTWLRTDPQNSFVRLTKERDVLSTLSPAQARAFKEQLKLCD
ncbi:MAG: hypothetical protein AAF679_10850 [Pseudomonadota bacterium]